MVWTTSCGTVLPACGPKLPTWRTLACIATFEVPSESLYTLTTPKHPLDASGGWHQLPCLASRSKARISQAMSSNLTARSNWMLGTLAAFPSTSLTGMSRIISWIHVENSKLFEAVEVFELHSQIQLDVGDIGGLPVDQSH
ncbi:hypothetical protein PPTG_13321 [Phytophthora nicotianae INRA-310]|uniref:Uncharacterized protein n=1 Tax=Phytophthora nicotianae (strain INRA-310) TaxID=761204 RepID=W2Q566_PHYN3|nr:hypothetical protein PPTG_13321 [Phytophthora nicotianae INRA-310]ETN07410.1 hypothetical protein PPTG_13321 [Phytophthora nicotianae INRA-310]